MKGWFLGSSGRNTNIFVELYLIMPEIDERFLDVDRYGVLKIPAGLWLGMAFLARNWILLIATLASRRSPEALQLASGAISGFLLLLQFPVLILAYAGFSRQPGTGRILRFVWSNGGAILCAAAALNLGLLGWFLWHSDVWRRWPELFLASCGLIDFAIAYGTFKSKYIRQVFQEFPEHASPESKAS